MNKTKIDWCDYTWNPVTGCLHNCPYCYARKIANRFGKNEFRVLGASGVVLDEPMKFENRNDLLTINPYPYNFLPTFHRYRLDEPQKIKTPKDIFVCSMADLFGDWVPDEWIEEVFKACEKAPWHQYMFLTKNPKRYAELALLSYERLKDNWWFGTTVTNQSDMDKANVSIMETPCDMKCFLSIEPLLGQVKIKDIAFLNWIIVGQQTNPTIAPKEDWVRWIIDPCEDWGVPVFIKEPLYKKYPIQEYPIGLRKERK